MRGPTATAGRAQEEVLTRIDRLVFSHAFAEETVLWPVLRLVLPDGDALTLRVEEEHQEVNEQVAALERDGADDPQRQSRLARLVEVLREDVRDEEDVLFPRLQDAVDPEELRRLGRRWQIMRRLSPTRPHPTVSRRPPGNALSGLPLTVLDRSRDAVDAGEPGPRSAGAGGPGAEPGAGRPRRARGADPVVAGGRRPADQPLTGGPTLRAAGAGTRGRSGCSPMVAGVHRSPGLAHDISTVPHPAARRPAVR
ncbi:hemerythrin domain-containing protein [Blastococcus sp. CT_GayMR16]|uniref:hemerythrin domain-containing protein n=1 Tax=Blastococcus sp. CT_GayMR16 TaxID=2559607 RepID=UPI001FD771EF|nr:hemerythrin domain-containing protein [Blastococcus sp. CT_GayMR16]